MGSDWREYKIGDLGRVVTGKTPSTQIARYFGGQYPFITIPDMGTSVYISETARTLSQAGAEVMKSCRLPKDSVMMSCIATIGKCGITTKDSFTNQQINSVICDHKKVYPLYLYYVFTQLDFELDAAGGGGSVYTNVSKSRFSDISVVIPHLPEQRAIAHILGSLDDKIELNRRMNQTLEAIARAIFKSWFVDFDPVRAKSEGRPTGLPDDIAAIFPDSFEDSDVGEVPRGWGIKLLGEIATTALGGQWGEEKPSEGLIPAVCLRGCDMEDLRREGFAHKAPMRFIKENAIEKRLPRENDFLIAASGAGPCGRPLWCSSLINQAYKQPVIYSNFVKRFSTPGPEYAVYLDRLFQEKFIDKSIQDFITGTSVPNLDSKGLMTEFRIVVPPEQILKIFYKQNKSIFEKLYSVENVVLSNLRDTLLPKLISGDLRVPDAEKFVGEAGI